MDASSITKKKNDGTLYSAYINQTIPPVASANTTRFSNPNTEPQVFQYYQDLSSNKFYNIQQYAANDFINFQLQNDVTKGAQVCGNTTTISSFNTQELAAQARPYVCPKSKLKFTTGPVIICPNTNFYQGTNFNSSC